MQIDREGSFFLSSTIGSITNDSEYFYAIRDPIQKPIQDMRWLWWTKWANYLKVVSFISNPEEYDCH